MSAPGELIIKVPQHAMPMVIGKKGAQFRDLQSIPELSDCHLDQLANGGVFQCKGSLRALGVTAQRIDAIINRSYECNVAAPAFRTSHSPSQLGPSSAYSRPRAESSYLPPAKRHRSSVPPAAASSSSGYRRSSSSATSVLRSPRPADKDVDPRPDADSERRARSRSATPEAAAKGTPPCSPVGGKRNW